MEELNFFIDFYINLPKTFSLFFPVFFYTQKPLIFYKDKQGENFSIELVYLDGNYITLYQQ